MPLFAGVGIGNGQNYPYTINEQPLTFPHTQLNVASVSPLQKRTMVIIYSKNVEFHQHCKKLEIMDTYLNHFYVPNSSNKQDLNL